MKSFKIFTILCVIVSLEIMGAYSQDDSSSKRNNLLARKPNRGSFNKAATTTTTPAPEYDDEEQLTDDVNYEDGEEDKDAQQNDVASSTTTSTEAPKRVGPVIRPFRSNEDLLLALKRRQQNNPIAKVHHERPAPKVQALPKDDDQSDEKTSAEAAPSKPALNLSGSKRRFAGGSRAAAPSAAQDSQAFDEAPQSSAQPRRPGRSRFFGAAA